jgi:2-keto-3-deoxy-L-rhamnonate aldolase RhmA
MIELGVQNMLKSKLLNNEFTMGSWITIGSPDVAEIMANANYDWLVVDLEHSVISIDVAGNLIRVIELSGIAPLVRLTSNDSNQIKRMMDAGAHGIIVPMVNSVEDAKHAVAATRYAPKGIRGVGLARAQGYGSKFKEYLDWQATEPVVIVQIEHIDAINNLEDIINVEGVDGFIIGPYDLSCSMGIPGQFDDKEFISVMNHILSTGKRLALPTGIHIVEPDVKLLEKSIMEGYNFIAYSVDIRMLDVSSRNAFEKVKSITK